MKTCAGVCFRDFFVDVIDILSVVSTKSKFDVAI